MLTDFWGLSSGLHLHSFQLFESANAAVCSHLCFSSLDSFLSVSSQGCFSHRLHYLFFFCRGDLKLHSHSRQFCYFLQSIACPMFGWQKFCGSLARQLGMVSIAAVPCVVPACGLGPFSLKSCFLCWPNSEQFPQLFAKIPLFWNTSWTCTFNTEQEQRRGSEPY